MKNNLSKMLPVSAPPTPLIRVELLDAESLQSPTLTGPPARGSTEKPIDAENTYLRRDSVFSFHVGHIFLDVHEAEPRFGAKLVFVL